MRLIYLTTVDLYLHGVVASQAAEERNLHVWNNRCRPDDETLDADEFVGVYSQYLVNMRTYDAI